MEGCGSGELYADGVMMESGTCMSKGVNNIMDKVWARYRSHRKLSLFSKFDTGRALEKITVGVRLDSRSEIFLQKSRQNGRLRHECGVRVRTSGRAARVSMHAGRAERLTQHWLCPTRLSHPGTC